MKALKKHFLVEVNLPTVAAGQRYYLGDIPELRNKITQVIEVYQQTLFSVSPGQKTVVSQAGCRNITLTLCEENTEEMYQMPYLGLDKSLNGGLRTELTGKKFNLPKSYVTVNNVTGINAGESLCISYWYE